MRAKKSHSEWRPMNFGHGLRLTTTVAVDDEREGDDDDSEVDHIVESFHSPKDAESNNNVVTTT